jgi:hypothetical protein
MFPKFRMGAVRAPDGAGGNGGGGAPQPFTASLPEPLRAHEAFKDVKDVADLATRYVGAVTPKPFAEMLPKDIAGEAVFKDIKDLEGLARGYHGQAKLIGPAERRIMLPADPADKDGWNQVWSRLGRPESPEKYELKPATGADWGDEDKAFHAAILPTLFEHGVSNKAVQALRASWDKFADGVRTKANDAQTQRLKGVETALRTELGAAYDEHVQLGETALTHYATTLKLGDELVKDIRGAPLSARPALFKIFAALGRQLKEDGVTGRSAPGGDGRALSPVEATQQINAKMNDPEFTKRWRSSDKATRDIAMSELERLYTMQAAKPQT